MFKSETRKHYTGSTITEAHFPGGDFWYSRDASSAHRRLSLLSFCAFHVFTGYLNRLKGNRFGKGIEFSATSYRRCPWILSWLFNWCIGYSTSFRRIGAYIQTSDDLRGRNGRVFLNVWRFVVCLPIPRFIAKWHHKREMDRYEKQCEEQHQWMYANDAMYRAACDREEDEEMIGWSDE